MKIFYWGTVRFGYRQEGFQNYVLEKDYNIEYAKIIINAENKYLKFLFCMINDLLNFSSMLKSNIIYIPPMEHTILKIILGRIFRKKIICDIYAPLFDMTVNDEKIYLKNSVMGRLYWYRDRIAMSKSTLVLFLNEAEKDHFCKTVNLSSEKINSAIVPLIINRKPFAKLPYFLDKTRKLNMCWTGSYVSLQGLDKIIESAKILKSRNFNFILSIIGPENDKANKYEIKIYKEKLTDCIKFIKIWGDMGKWEEYICEKCDISLGIFGDSDKAKCVVANKVIDGIAFKTPIITGLSSGINNYFTQTNDIFTVNNTPIEIANKIIEVASKNISEINYYVENAYNIYIENFSKNAYNKNLDKIFKELI